VLNSLHAAYGPFILNYHMHDMDKKLNELHRILKMVKCDIKRDDTNQMLVQSTSKISFRHSLKKYRNGNFHG
jgi:hypothetical protein